MNDAEANTRKLRYRLKRQGMLELDTWLSRLEPVLGNHDEEFSSALEELLNCEPDELLAMMQGRCSVPEALRSWLARSESRGQPA